MARICNPEGVDGQYMPEQWRVGDRVFYAVTDEQMYVEIFKSGIITERWMARFGGVNSGGFWLWSLLSAAKKGHGEFDFAEVYLAGLLENKSFNYERNRARTNYNDLRVGSHFYYAVFLIDVYTKKIVCYQVSNHLRATANVKALKKALKTHQAPMIHHSDRGSQYTYGVYLELLKQHHCSISMSLIAQENAYAERIHRTIKEEYLSHWNPQTYEQLLRAVKKAVDHYNTKRPHNHLNKLSPVEFENQWKLFKQLPLLTIFDNENINKKTVNAI